MGGVFFSFFGVGLLVSSKPSKSFWDSCATSFFLSDTCASPPGLIFKNKKLRGVGASALIGRELFARIRAFLKQNITIFPLFFTLFFQKSDDTGVDSLEATHFEIQKWIT